MHDYIGHPYIDIGLATIAAFSHKQHPSQISESDMSAIADYMTKEYVRQPLRSFLTVVFPNSGFTQPAFFKSPERQQDYANRVLRGYAKGIPTLDETCAFTGEPAIAIAFGDKEGMPVGRAFRQHVPLTLGEETINFYPYGDAGLPVSGEALLAIQAFPLGCAKCAGRLLAVHSDNDDILFHFANSFLIENRKAVQLAQAAGSKKMPGPHFAFRTLLIDTLLRADQMQQESVEFQEPFSLTIYHMSNSGQGPELDIYELPFEIAGFLRDMEQPRFRTEWQAIVRAAWEVPPESKQKKQKEQPFRPSRNMLYESLFELPENGNRFIRTYFLRIAIRRTRNENDPRVNYSTRREAQLVSWKITARFLWRVMHMDKERIEIIRRMGDCLADYINRQNDRYLYTNFRNQNYHQFRTALLRANLAEVKRGNPPIIEFDSYIEVFEFAENDAMPRWRLARDLVFIKMIERLYQSGWLDTNADAVADIIDEDEELTTKVEED